jgi:hypothetical protein
MADYQRIRRLGRAHACIIAITFPINIVVGIP